MCSKLLSHTNRTGNNRAASRKNFNDPRSRSADFPRARGAEGCVVVPRTLAAFIPEIAARKFAAKEPFTVHVDCGVGEYLVLYGGE